MTKRFSCLLVLLILILLSACGGATPQIIAVEEAASPTVTVIEQEPSGGPSDSIQIEIIELQNAIDAEGLGWQAGVTSLSYLTDEEFAALCGENSPLTGMANTNVSWNLNQAELPESFDWRDFDGDWTTPIRNQGQCGSCVAHAAVAVMESLTNVFMLSPNLDIDLSESDLFACGCGNCCKSGWTLEEAAQHLQDVGVAEEACHPYQPFDAACKGGVCQRDNFIFFYRRLNTLAEMKKSLYLNGPLLARMAVYRDFKHYAGGVYRPKAGSSLVGGHAVTIVGYDDAGGYWIVKNSWGTQWGESQFRTTCSALPPKFAPPTASNCGWFRIAYGAALIDQYAIELSLYPTGTMLPSGEDRIKMLRLDAKNGDLLYSGVVVNASTSVRVFLGGNACPGGGMPCDDPNYHWFPMVHVGSAAAQLPASPFTITPEWIGASGPLYFSFADTFYGDNTGEAVIRLVVIRE